MGGQGRGPNGCAARGGTSRAARAARPRNAPAPAWRRIMPPRRAAQRAMRTPWHDMNAIEGRGSLHAWHAHYMQPRRAAAQRHSSVSIISALEQLEFKLDWARSPILLDAAAALVHSAVQQLFGVVAHLPARVVNWERGMRARMCTSRGARAPGSIQGRAGECAAAAAAAREAHPPGCATACATCSTRRTALTPACSVFEMPRASTAGGAPPSPGSGP